MFYFTLNFLHFIGLPFEEMFCIVVWHFKYEALTGKQMLVSIKSMFNGYHSNSNETALLDNKDYALIIPQQYLY